MSQENVEVVRRIYRSFPAAQDALRRGDFPIGQPLAEEIEWDASEMGLPDMGDGHLHGREGVRRFWVAWLSAWEDISFEFELRDAGDDVVAVIDLRSRGSEIEMPMLRHGQLWTFEDGEVIRWKLYMDHKAALEAAGLRE
jgi:ketosteroid isomerase-like protein